MPQPRRTRPRGRRFGWRLLLTLGLLVGRWALVPILGFLAVATLATTVQRLVHVAAKLPGPDPAARRRQ